MLYAVSNTNQSLTPETKKDKKMVIEFKSTRTGDYRLKYIERKETQKIAKVNRVTHGPSLFFSELRQ